MNAKLEMSIALILCGAFLPAAGQALDSGHAEVVKGHVEIVKADDRQAVLKVDRYDADGQRDGITDDVIEFRSASVLTAVAEWSGDARLVTLDRTVAVWPELGRPMLFTLFDQTGEAVAPRAAWIDFAPGFIHVDTGVELGRYQPSPAVRNLDRFVEELLASGGGGDLLKAVAGGGECAAGGPGATSCSLGNDCSKSCSSGEGYACCNPGDCVCSGGGGVQ